MVAGLAIAPFLQKLGCEPVEPRFRVRLPQLCLFVGGRSEWDGRSTYTKGVFLPEFSSNFIIAGQFNLVRKEVSINVNVKEVWVS